MELLTPLALLTGLVIPAIIILYMLKKRTRPQTVSSIMLWQRLERVNRPALRLSKLLRSLLLALQLLTALLLVLALARPVLNIFAGSGETSIVIIDTSISMGVKDGDTRLEQAVERVRSRIRGKAPGDKVALIAMGEEAVVLSGFSTDSAALLAALAQVGITSARANPNAALALAANMAAAEDGATIILYSAGCFGPLARLPEGGFDFIALGSGEVENLLIEDAVSDGDRLYVTVFNNGTVAAAASIEIRDAQGQLTGRREVKLDPQQRQVLVWRNLPQSPWISAAVVSAGDQLELDNIHYSLLDQDAAGKLLLVSEGNLFLERALVLYPDISVSRVAPASYKAAMAGMYDYFVFDGFLPSELPAAPTLVFDPPHPNPHFGTGAAVKIQAYRPLSHPLLAHADFSDVSIGFGKAIVGGSGLLEFEGGLLATAMERQGLPLVVFGFALQAGDLPLRPAFPILLRNVLDSFTGSRQPSTLLRYGDLVPAGEMAVLSFGGDPLPQGHRLGAGAYILVTGETQELILLNPPVTTDSVATRDILESPGGQVKGKGERGMPLLWPLILSALLLVGTEWWVDNYGG
jgi:Ca-activated chloride channel family protein